jgi:hypothetical protein
VTPGFVRAHIPFWFRNSQHKLSRCRLRNHHRNRFHRSRVDSSALSAADENWVTVVFEIVSETDSKGDAWIRQRPWPLLTEK